MKCVQKALQYVLSSYQTFVKQHSHTVELSFNYLHEHFCEPISLEQVAGYAGKSPNYFSSVFEKETGSGFTEYLAKVRMERAHWLLLNTNLQIQEIYKEVGYNGYIYFS